jgi:hypothetical protein
MIGAIILLWLGVYVASFIILCMVVVPPHDFRAFAVTCAFNATAWVFIITGIRGIFA